MQLLVTDSDVKNYTQIKVDLDELRNLVEKSELWVYKEKKNDENRKKKSSGSGKTNVRIMAFFLPDPDNQHLMEQYCNINVFSFHNIL